MSVYWREPRRADPKTDDTSAPQDQENRPEPFFSRFLENPFKVRSGIQAGLARRSDDGCTQPNSCTCCGDRDDC